MASFVLLVLKHHTAALSSVFPGPYSVHAPAEYHSAEAADTTSLAHRFFKSFIRESNNSGVPVDIRQNLEDHSVPSSVCVGEECFPLFE